MDLDVEGGEECNWHIRDRLEQEFCNGLQNVQVGSCRASPVASWSTSVIEQEAVHGRAAWSHDLVWCFTGQDGF